MEIAERYEGPVTVVTLSGRLILGPATERLGDKVNSLFHQGRTQLVLDLGSVTYIDSGGLGELVRTYTTAKSKQGRVCIANIPEKVENLLAITKLLTVFDVYETDDAAVANLAG